MFNNKNNKTLLELSEIAKHVNYAKPELPLDRWNNEQVFYGATTTALKDELLMKACFIICDTFPPLKLFFKKILRDYIKAYS